MKALIASIVSLVVASTAFAQSPGRMSYKLVQHGDVVIGQQWTMLAHGEIQWPYDPGVNCARAMGAPTQGCLEFSAFGQFAIMPDDGADQRVPSTVKLALVSASSEADLRCSGNDQLSPGPTLDNSDIRTVGGSYVDHYGNTDTGDQSNFKFATLHIESPMFALKYHHDLGSNPEWFGLCAISNGADSISVHDVSNRGTAYLLSMDVLPQP